MKIFEIITEADARVLARGETVTLAAGGHVTPLAQDTLKERRVTVLRPDRLSPEDASLAPSSDIRVVAVATDRGSAALGRTLVAFLRSRGLAVTDVGTGGPGGTESADDVDAAAAVADIVAHREADAGIVIDGTGIGSAIAANKVPGIRAATATSATVARHARERHGANVLTLGATLVTEAEMKTIVTTWLTASMREPGDIRRLAKIQALERRGKG